MGALSVLLFSCLKAAEKGNTASEHTASERHKQVKQSVPELAESRDQNLHISVTYQGCLLGIGLRFLAAKIRSRFILSPAIRVCRSPAAKLTGLCSQRTYRGPKWRFGSISGQCACHSEDTQKERGKCALPAVSEHLLQVKFSLPVKGFRETSPVSRISKSEGAIHFIRSIYSTQPATLQACGRV